MASPSFQIANARRRVSVLSGYAVAAAATALCLAFSLSLDRVFHDDLAFLLFVPALLAGAWAGALAMVVAMDLNEIVGVFVRDTGHGVSAAAAAERMFQPYTTTKPHGGGTIFRFTLPAVRSDELVSHG